MTKIEIGTVIAVIVAIVGGAVWIGQLSGRMESIEKLNPQKEARDLIDQANKLVVAVDERFHKLGKEKRILPEISIRKKTKVFEFRRNHAEDDELWTRADLCFFTRIGGNFAGAGEFVEVFERNDRWHFRGNNGGPQRPHAIKVEVTCIDLENKPK